jgi:hypothetical protein
MKTSLLEKGGHVLFGRTLPLIQKCLSFYRIATHTYRLTFEVAPDETIQASLTALCLQLHLRANRKRPRITAAHEENLCARAVLGTPPSCKRVTKGILKPSRHILQAIGHTGVRESLTKYLWLVLPEIQKV